LAKIAQGKGAAPARLRRWFETLIATKSEKVLGDPEMFAVSREMFAESREVVAQHLAMPVGRSPGSSKTASGRAPSASPTARLRQAPSSMRRPRNNGSGGQFAADCG
jgi:hypothetical protein